MLRFFALIAFCFASLVACGSDQVEPLPESHVPPTALMDMVEMLRSDLDAERHVSDGGGRAWLAEGSNLEIPASHPGSWRIVFETGPDGIAEGGWIFFQVPPFWGWSTPQSVEPGARGYTEVETSAAGVQLDAYTADQHLLAIAVSGRALTPGEQVTIHYGSGEGGAISDRYAERSSPFWIAVDGDGDGIRALLDEAPSVHVTAGPPAGLIVTLESTAAPMSPVRLHIAVVDALGSICETTTPSIELQLPASINGPSSVTLTPEDRGSTETQIVAANEGVFRVRARTAEGLEGESNPLWVGEDLPKILWGDLHGHSGFSDGTGTPEDYFRYARDVAALDVVALTDHDHWGFPHLDQTPAMWQTIREHAASFHEPGRFVSLLGYEWTSWIYGHRHVLYFEDEGRVLSSLDPLYETPELLWKGLKNQAAITFAHHSAGGPIATDWSFAPDPVLEPVTEIVSVHGSSEAMDSPGLIYRPIEGNFVRDVLDRGFRLGFVGSGDGHDGHPGLSHLASPTGGLAAFVGAERTRESILETLRKRRVYATNGPRIVLVVSLDGGAPGSSLAPRKVADLRIEVVAPAPVRSVDVIRSGAIAETFETEGPNLQVESSIDDLRAGEYLYVRAVQIDGGAAWSSPFFVTRTAP